jgi:hypothetical protein
VAGVLSLEYSIGRVTSTEPVSSWSWGCWAYVRRESPRPADRFSLRSASRSRSMTADDGSGPGRSETGQTSPTLSALLVMSPKPRAG